LLSARRGWYACRGIGPTNRIPASIKAWSRAIHDHPDSVDGFRYVSRHLNTGMCYLVFDRAADKITLNNATPLSAHPDFGQVATGLYINNAMARPLRER
jgi:hypothetical protein